MTTGTIFLMWLGEQITERGMGNGISMIILVGIVAGLPGAVEPYRRAGQQRRAVGRSAPILLLGIVVGVTAFCVFMERAQRRITVNYAKRQVGRRMMRRPDDHLPFKLNMSGVIPPIFASSLLLFPATIAGFFGRHQPRCFGQQRMQTAWPPRWLTASRCTCVLYALLIIVLRVLLHGAGVQCARDGRQPEEVRRFHSGHPPRPADRRIHRQGADAPHVVGRAVHRRACA